MASKVEIVSSEMVKPSSPTPEDLRFYKLSLKDQMGACSPYISRIIFYATPSSDFSNRLKESLKLVLNHDCMYPLAGRIKDMYSIECNDQGALFMQARVNEDFSNVVRNPKNNIYLQLFPPPPPEVWKNPCERVLLAVQVSEFVNGGISISMSASRGITDGAALTFFLKNWAEIAQARSKGENYNIKSGFVEDLFGENTRGNIFTFKASSIATIKEKSSKIGEKKATSYEATSAFLWAAITTARKKSGKSLHMHVNCSALNLRTRLVPPYPLHCSGNLSHVAPASFGATEEVVELNVLAEKIRGSINKVTHEEMVKEHTNKDIKGIMEIMERTSIATEGIGLLVTSSLCRFPYYEVDFGWGKSSWVGLDRIRNNLAMFFDTVDGDGIEAWVRLPEEEMGQLEQDVDFLSYVSSIQSV